MDTLSHVLSGHLADVIGGRARGARGAGGVALSQLSLQHAVPCALVASSVLLHSGRQMPKL